MGFWFFLMLLTCSLPHILAQQSAAVIVRGSVTIAETNDNFVCATLDWWPPEKCNYNQCPWALSSILNLDLNNPLLSKAIQAFKTLRIRIGGTLQDQVIYDVPNSSYSCTPFTRKEGELFGFSVGCLTIPRWDELNFLFQKTGAIITFGLNALLGRHHVSNSVWEGAWNSTNARSFMEYTVSKGYPVDSWELGNEISGRGIGASVSAEQYGKDAIELKSIIDEIYNKSRSRPLLIAPGGFYEQQWYARFLQVSGPNVVDALTHHMYNIGAGNDPELVSKIMDPKHLSYGANTFRDLELTIQRHGSWSSAWVGESGGAYNSGGKDVSNTFINSFWYLDQLGMAAKYNTKVYCRQTLIGGNYGLLDTNTFVPNPDFYSALLWHRLMGKRVLSVDISSSPYLKAYAHCTKQRSGMSLLLINMSNVTGFNVAVRNDMNVYLAEGGGFHSGISFVRNLKKTVSWVGRRILAGTAKREEYHLTPKDGFHRSRTMLLNGIPLELTQNGDIPALSPVLNPLNSPMFVAPLSIAFIVFPNFEAPACT